MQSAVQRARNRLGGTARNGTAADVEQARRDLAAAKLAQHVTEDLAGSPPLTEQDLAPVYALLDAAPRARALT
jgi:hypothetical protein